jgi:hypothetical protein
MKTPIWAADLRLTPNGKGGKAGLEQLLTEVAA